MNYVANQNITFYLSDKLRNFNTQFQDGVGNVKGEDLITLQQ